MLIGGQAVLLHGRPRLTEDITITLGVDPGRLPVVLEPCTALGLELLPDRVEEFVRDTFVLPVPPVPFASAEDLARSLFGAGASASTQGLVTGSLIKID